jgi:hypothetical protein
VGAFLHRARSEVPAIFSLLRVLVLSTLAYLHPGALSAAVISDAIASEVSRSCSDHGALGSCELDAVALAVSAEQEGRLCLGAACVRGDHGRSASTFQVMGLTPADTARYENDLGAATRQAYAILRTGASQCPEEPLAPYCGGCGRRGARVIARPRLELARAILEIVRPPEVILASVRPPETDDAPDAIFTIEP